MEEKKFDLNALIGFVLIGVIILYMLYQNQPTPEELEERAKQEQVDKETPEEQGQTTLDLTQTEAPIVVTPTDSTSAVQAQSALGAFAYSASLPSAMAKETVLENDVVSLKVNNQGG